jgi:uncharacterized damage-inducible protein DinB
VTSPIDVRDLVAYTGWQRGVWQQWFAHNGADALGVTTGSNGDGRFPTVGSVIRHIFSAELRYLQRIAGLPLTDASSVPTDDPVALFDFGSLGRARFVVLLETLPPASWDTPLEFPLLNGTARANPRKIILHVLIHEIRHWAQVATLLRLQGWVPERLDLLLSPVLGVAIHV